MDDYLFLVGYGIIAFAVAVVGISLRQSQKKAEAERKRTAEKIKKRVEAAKSVKQVPWTNKYAIDGGVLDEDHKELFNLVKEFNAGILTYQATEDMVPVLKSLTDYMQSHFEREEKLQEAAEFPFRKEHKEEHVDLIKKFNELKKKVLAADEDKITDVAVEIANFLQGWLSDHVIEADILMKPYMDQLNEGSKDTGESAPETKIENEETEAPSETAVQ